METLKIKVYDFDELNKDAKQKVIKEFQKDVDFPFLETNLNEQLTFLLESNKIKAIREPKLEYCLSYSQGDGVCFWGLFEWRNRTVIIEKTNHHYCHSRTTRILFEDSEGNTLYGDESDLIKKDMADFESIYFRICEEIEKMGYEEIEYQESEECIVETIKANEYRFLADGRIPNFMGVILA